MDNLKKQLHKELKKKVLLYPCNSDLKSSFMNYDKLKDVDLSIDDPDFVITVVHNNITRIVLEALFN